MNTSIVDVQLRQSPLPGSALLRHRGDTVTFTLSMATPAEGGAWLRTNIGHAAVGRREAVGSVEDGEPPQARDWYDLPMERVAPLRFRIRLPLTETGHFEAKCFFLPDGADAPRWPPGPNAAVNVEPAETCCGNILYNAFVRQFGPNRDGAAAARWAAMDPSAFDADGFTVIPPSGKFRDLIRELDFIVGTLGCTVIQLLPIHPTPTTYARMGRFGSPYAALSFTEVDPALAVFDPAATPLEQFLELVDAVHEREARLLLDIAINHTGWAASLHADHPEWLVRDTDGTIEVPGAWGVAWEDLTRLDYDRKPLWIYMADVFLTWARRGVDGFRCDAGYMIPEAAWRYIVARVRQEYPDTVFFLEGLGGKISVTRALLNRANLDWAYSELFQNYDRAQIEAYLPGAIEISASEGLTVHFAETHDNLRLAARSTAWARLRTRLCALFSPQGAFAFANGVEWFATEKINVHESPSLNWGAAENQVDDIGRLSAILKTHPAFWSGTRLELITEGEGNAVVLLRHHPASGKRLVVAANLDPDAPVAAGWSRKRAGTEAPRWVDLLSERAFAPRREGAREVVDLGPGEVVCLSPDPKDRRFADPGARRGAPARALRQRLRAKAMEVATVLCDVPRLGGIDWNRAADELADDPAGLCRRFHPQPETACVVPWHYPRDLRREVMVPPGAFLLVRAPFAFRAAIRRGEATRRAEAALPAGHGGHFALFSPLGDGRTTDTLTLSLSVFEPGSPRHGSAPIRVLAPATGMTLRTRFTAADIESGDRLYLGTNGRGGMCRAHARWGELPSRYDALLAANLSPDFPEDRRVMLARVRGWAVYQGHSQVLRADGTEDFRVLSRGGARWRMQLPTGQGQSVRLHIDLAMTPGENAVEMAFRREPAGGAADLLADEKAVELILRPDVEDRSFHETTKAFTGPEQRFPAAVVPGDDRFRFSPSPPAALEMELPGGRYVHEPEWHYMVHRPVEADRGLDPDSDLFSPGYFRASLGGGETARLRARVTTGRRDPVSAPEAEPSGPNRAGDPSAVLAEALDAYVVRRGDFATVIAGYPWFLDWGRDTLIFVRGLVAAGRHRTSRDIIRQFAAFEEGGTLPNMIRGLDASNRDTSDAPLWLAVACADLVKAEGGSGVLDMACGRRKLRRVLADMARSLAGGTANGIRMDPDSGLLFSPSHFTWMDTNHPAGTPREGYPIEIQALWYAALRLLGRHGPGAERSEWRALADRVRRSIADLFFLKEEGYLSDCLHAGPGCPARDAEPDDALRPNQLLAVTLGAVGEGGRRRRIVDACLDLLVPGAIRSLADRPVSRPLRILRDGRLLADPHHPYQGRYAGDEDTRRKPAYHNGTAWTWPFPSFCEAWAIARGAPAVPTARAWLASGFGLLESGCLGHLPEILDGDLPHTPRGCDAQAWGASEYLRVWRFLEGAAGPNGPA